MDKVLSLKRIVDLTDKYVAHTYKRFPVAFIRGRGTHLWDSDGKRYLDFVSGIAVCNLGHCHPKVTDAVKRQSERLLHVSNLYYMEPQARLAELLCRNSFADKVFFCNSGAEANEAAIKLARKYFYDRGEKRSKVISMEKSFHGRTMATMAATGQKKIQEGFEPLLEKFCYVPFNDVRAVEERITDDTAAVMVEPVQGEGGVNLPDSCYLKDLKALCREKGLLLIFDEVQVGMGRTGTLFAYENFDVFPDIMTLAKGLAGGIPIGAMLASEDVAEAFTPGSHASTFGGNPLAASAGIAALEVTMQEGILNNCRSAGSYLMERLKDINRESDHIKTVRGKGLIVAMELSVPGSEIVMSCLERGLLINCTAGNVLRFLPPLIVTTNEIDDMIIILRDVLRRHEVMQ